MFQVVSDFGVLIDENAVNVGLVHEHAISPPDKANDDAFFHTGFYLGSDTDGGVVIDIPIPEYIKYPLVGISFKYGVGYAQISYRKNGQRFARVFLCVHRATFIKHYPQYAYAKSMNHISFMFEVMKKEPFKALFFDINPPIRQSGLGLEIFNSKGEVVYDSDLPTVNFPMDIHTNADSYRSFVICQSFIPLRLLFEYYYPPIRMILDRSHSPLLWMATKTHGHGEMLSVLIRANPKYNIENPIVHRLVSDFQNSMYRRFLLCSY
ncbi:hypothetical protein B0182_06755 [Moraxella bovis]|nr:hypothetical protein B0182_06755 [Moraxella bovis]